MTLKLLLHLFRRTHPTFDSKLDVDGSVCACSLFSLPIWLSSLTDLTRCVLYLTRYQAVQDAAREEVILFFSPLPDHKNLLPTPHSGLSLAIANVAGGASERGGEAGVGAQASLLPGKYFHLLLDATIL